MKIKLIILTIFFYSYQAIADSYEYVNLWPDKKFQDFHHISIVKDNNKELGILKNDQGQFVSLETNMPLNGNYKIQGDTYNFKNGLLHGEVFGATYRNGLLHGVIRQYSTYYNGKSTPSYLSAKLHFVNGVPSGTQTWFSPSGDIIETAFYQKGKRLSYEKNHKKIKSQYTIPKYDDEKSKVIHKFLEVCSKSKVNKRFDNRSHIFIYTGHDLDPNCLQKEYTSYRNSKYTITTYEDFPWGRRSEENYRCCRRYPADDYDENVILNQESTYIKILSPEKESCGEGCWFEYDHLYFFDKTFVYLTDFYGYRSYTSLDELDGQFINYGMSMLTHHRNYMYSVQDILNPEKDISSFYFYGDSQTEITPDSYTTSWEKKYWQGGGALWISTKRNYKNEILELKSWGNVCQNLSEHIFENLNSSNTADSLSYEYFKLEIMSYLTRYPRPKWWLAALAIHKDDQWCYEDPKR